MSTRFGFVSTFPPTQCGLATFTAALRGALLHSTTDEGWVVRLIDAPAPRPGDEVVAQLITDDAASLGRAAEQLNLCDVAIVQHEYGVYGGADGSQILHLLDQVRVPCVVVLHTVLTHPTPHQRRVLESVMAKADAVVAMTMIARDRLGSWITFDDHYRNTSALASLVRSADVVLLPYDSTEQVTSGVLIEAVAAGKPVVATQFPHAREVLAGGAGLLVPHRDPAAIAAALCSVIKRGDVMTRMAAAAAATAPPLLWPVIADQYRELADRLITGSVAA
jgi:glycosyltransferase involved in cell wall biosynthesis